MTDSQSEVSRNQRRRARHDENEDDKGQTDSDRTRVSSLVEQTAIDICLSSRARKRIGRCLQRTSRLKSQLSRQATSLVQVTKAIRAEMRGKRQNDAIQEMAKTHQFKAP